MVGGWDEGRHAGQDAAAEGEGLARAGRSLRRAGILLTLPSAHQCTLQPYSTTSLLLSSKPRQPGTSPLTLGTAAPATQRATLSGECCRRTRSRVPPAAAPSLTRRTQMPPARQRHRNALRRPQVRGGEVELEMRPASWWCGPAKVASHWSIRTLDLSHTVCDLPPLTHAPRLPGLPHAGGLLHRLLRQPRPPRQQVARQAGGVQRRVVRLLPGGEGEGGRVGG